MFVASPQLGGGDFGEILVLLVEGTVPKAQAYCVFLVGTRQKDVVLFIALSSIIFFKLVSYDCFC